MQNFRPRMFWARYGNGSYDNCEFVTKLDELPGFGSSGPWLCGGSVRRFISGEALDTDFDIFFYNEDQKDKFARALTRKGFKKGTSNKFNTVYTKDEMIVQLIHINYYTSVQDVLRSFDFSLCQFGYDGASIYAADWSLWDLGRRRLVPEKISYGVSSLRRILKYARQGFTICAGGFATILQQVVDNPEIIQHDIEYID